MALQDIRTYYVNVTNDNIAANSNSLDVDLELDYPTELIAIGGVPDLDPVTLTSQCDNVSIEVNGKEWNRFKFNHNGLNQLPDFIRTSRAPPMMFGAAGNPNSLTLKMKARDTLRLRTFAGATPVDDPYYIRLLLVEYRNESYVERVFGRDAEDFDTLTGGMRQGKPEVFFYNLWLTNSSATTPNAWYELNRTFGNAAYNRKVPDNIERVIEAIGVVPHANQINTAVRIGTQTFPHDLYPFVTNDIINTLPFGDDDDFGGIHKLGEFSLRAKNETLVPIILDNGVSIPANGANVVMIGRQITF